jgi:hypothetical protein
MRRRVTPALVFVLLVGGAVAAQAVPASAAEPAPVAGATRTVTLVTGDRVTVAQTPNGRPSVTVAPGTSGNFQVLASGSHLYVIPQIAAGYVGAPLDLGMFDVNADTSNYALPLTATGAVPPGMAQTAAGLMVRDRAAFGKALARDWTAAKHGGASGHLFDGVVALHPRPTPPGKLYTLTVKAYDRLGHRASGDLGVVMNADNIDNFLAGQGFFNGQFAFSVPAGHYSISSYIGTGYSDGSVDFTLAEAPEVSVTRDTTVVLDARDGTRLSADVGAPAPQLTAQLNVQRNPATGVSLTDSFVTFDTTPLYATPTAPVTTGQLYFYPGMRLGDPQTELYDMEFPYIGAIPQTLTETLQASDFATIDARFHSPVPGRAEYESREGAQPWQAVAVFGANEVVAPDTRTEHVLATPGMVWLQQVILDEADSLGTASEILHTYQPGQQLTDDWAAQPVAPGIEQETDAPQSCPACRSGDTLNLMLFGNTDAQGHLMLPDSSSTESMTLYQDGTQVGQTPIGFAAFPLDPSPAGYRLVYDTARDAAWWPTSTRTHTEWTFTSAERPADQLPPGWTCGGKGGGGGGGRGAPATADGCSFEPLLFTRYATGAGTDDVVPAGHPASVEVNVAHQRGAAASPITQFSAQVSYDDGVTWTDVPATRLAEGSYRLDYSQPELNATNGFASLHVTAADANGSAIDQTITRAYPLAVIAPAPPSGNPAAPEQHACADAAPPYLSCMAIIDAAAGTTTTPQGYGPTDIQAAYAIPPHLGNGRTIAIVDAYDDPNAEADLAAYRAQFGLPPCTTANGCFRKVNQHGAAAPLPDPNPGWGLEISLDLDAVSAACPDCHILLVEADSSGLGDLLTGVLSADAAHVDAISNSYGSRGEFSGEQQGERYLRALNAPALFATGDYGYGNGAILIGGISYPAASRYTIAVGGTSLVRDAGPRGWTESAWDGATSGCSAYIHKPAWQRDDLCGMRTVADLSAVADPATGLAVYDTFGYAGWLQVGGTSLATPIVASVYTADLRDLYRDPEKLYDVTSGSNGTNCSGTYLCTAVPGYDGPTGLGTPNVSSW